MVWVWKYLEGGETFSDVESGEEDCFEHSVRFCEGFTRLEGSVMVAVHMLVVEWEWRKEGRMLVPSTLLVCYICITAEFGPRTCTNQVSCIGFSAYCIWVYFIYIYRLAQA